jgi:hypothetical protein
LVLTDLGIVIGLLKSGGGRRILNEGSSGVEGRPLEGAQRVRDRLDHRGLHGTLLTDIVRRGEVRLNDPDNGCEDMAEVSP